MDATREPVPVVLALANAGRPTRPPGQREPQHDGGLTTLDAASAILAPLLPGQQLATADLPALAELAHEVSEITSRLSAGDRPPRLETLNRIARDVIARRALAAGPDGRLVAALQWQSAPPAAELARRAIEELGRLNPARLRVCARPECSLLFYDTTRSNTQRWHSDAPCGWRERQQRRRSAPHPS
ncbi:MAG TPA: CGNR zinc finger domain-containing protein [Solirubrobacteraceae bacterium]|jgi:predicted RNA-binding Zn ribbon-like protein